MKQNITNDLQDSIIEGNSVINYFNHQMEKTIKENKDKIIFLSYNWHGTEITDRMDKNLSGLSNITVKRDIRDIGTWKSIREFIKAYKSKVMLF